jgi:hypothetical protein
LILDHFVAAKNLSFTEPHAAADALAAAAAAAPGMRAGGLPARRASALQSIGEEE